MTKRLVAFNADFDEAVDGTYWGCTVCFNEPGIGVIHSPMMTFVGNGPTPEEALGFALADAEKHGFVVS